MLTGKDIIDMINKPCPTEEGCFVCYHYYHNYYSECTLLCIAILYISDGLY